MKKLLLLLPALLLLAFSTPAQIPIGSTWQASSASNTFTLLHSTNVGAWASSSTTGTTSSFPATGSGHLLVVMSINGGTSSNFLTAVSGGCTSSWQILAATAGNNNGQVSAAYCLNSSAGATTLNLTQGSANSASFATVWEYSFTQGSCSLAASQAGLQTGNGTTLTGQTLSLSQNSVILQSASVGGTVTGVNSPYGNFTSSSGTSLVYADYENTSTGTAAGWLTTNASANPTLAMAFQ